jgi:hypothetical protein
MNLCSQLTIARRYDGKFLFVGNAEGMISWYSSPKYLYLLFDPTPEPLSSKVFTTEGHPLYMPFQLQKQPSKVRRTMHRGEDLKCPAYVPTRLGGWSWPHRGDNDWYGGLIVGIESRNDYDYAAHLIGVQGDGDTPCVIPKAPRFVRFLYCTEYSQWMWHYSPRERARLLRTRLQARRGSSETRDQEVSLFRMSMGSKWNVDGDWIIKAMMSLKVSLQLRTEPQSDLIKSVEDKLSTL